MKKLMIILLIGMLSLGLSGVAFADAADQEINATITASLSFAVPTPLSGWVFTYNTSTGGTQSNTTNDTSVPAAANSHTAKIDANCPYTLTVMVSTTASPTGETVDVKMTSISGTTTPDLTETLELMLHDAGSSTIDKVASFSALTDITTGAATFLGAGTPDDGTDIVGIQFSQSTTATDAAYEGTTQLTYQIKLTWTATTNI